MNPVDEDIYRAVAEAVSPEFAFSYLVKAEQRGRSIIPFTYTAWTRLRDSYQASEALRRMKVTLVRPEPYSEAREERKRRQQQMAA